MRRGADLGSSRPACSLAAAAAPARRSSSPATNRRRRPVEAPTTVPPGATLGAARRSRPTTTRTARDDPPTSVHDDDAVGVTPRLSGRRPRRGHGAGRHHVLARSHGRQRDAIDELTDGYNPSRAGSTSSPEPGRLPRDDRQVLPVDPRRSAAARDVPRLHRATGDRLRLGDPDPGVCRGRRLRHLARSSRRRSPPTRCRCPVGHAVQRVEPGPLLQRNMFRRARGSTPTIRRSRSTSCASTRSSSSTPAPPPTAWRSKWQRLGRRLVHRAVVRQQGRAVRRQRQRAAGPRDRVLYDGRARCRAADVRAALINDGLAVYVGDNAGGADKLLKLADAAAPAAMALGSSAFLGTVISTLAAGSSRAWPEDIGVGAMPGPVRHRRRSSGAPPSTSPRARATSRRRRRGTS